MRRTNTHQLVIVPARQVGVCTWAVVTQCSCGHPLTAVSSNRQSCARIINRKMADHRRAA